MAFGTKKKASSKGGSTKKLEKKYVNIASVLEGEDRDDGTENLYIKASNFKGRLIWQEFGGEKGDDESESVFWEIKTAFIGAPHENSPDFVKQNLVVNLLNPKAAAKLEQ